VSIFIKTEVIGGTAFLFSVGLPKQKPQEELIRLTNSSLLTWLASYKLHSILESISLMLF
jgi:hypothetical protein